MTLDEIELEGVVISDNGNLTPWTIRGKNVYEHSQTGVRPVGIVKQDKAYMFVHGKKAYLGKIKYSNSKTF